VAQPLAGEPQPVPLGVVAEQDLGDGQTDQLGVAELGAAAWPLTRTQQLVDGDVQCDDEGVEIGAHEASQEVDEAVATSTFGALVSLVIPSAPSTHSKAII
jgi:hypothetical protein